MAVLVPPRFATPRTPGRPTLGAAVTRAASRMGIRLGPHQQLVSDVAGEVLPDGRMAYPVVVVLMPRRGGKTKLLLPTFVQRSSFIPSARCWYTAQTGADAGSTFREDWLPELQPMKDAGLVTTRMSNGSESFALPTRSSRVAVFAPTPKALHGKDADVVGIDEAWAFSMAQGKALMQAVKPAQLTRPQRQLWVISAGGDDSSEWLLDWRELGRALTGPDQGIAYFEWHPEVVERDGGGYDLAPWVDLDDPAVWANTHPAVGNHATVEALAEDRAVFGADEFSRAYLNVFQTGALVRVLPRIAWDRNVDPDVGVEPGPGVVVAYDVAPESSSSSIVLARRDIDGAVVAEHVDEGPGSGWVADRVDQLCLRWGADPVADSRGPASVVTAELQRRGRVVRELDAGDVANAAEQLLAALLEDRITVRQSDVMDAAAAAAAKRQLLDRWAFTRRGSSGNVAPVVALSFAHSVALAATDSAIVIETAS